MHPKHVLAAAGSILAIFLLASFAPAVATPQPADKMGTSGATIELFGAGEDVVLLVGDLHLSAPTDLLIALSLECSILGATDGHMEAWVEMDGAPVSVAGLDDGRVVACDQAHAQTLSPADGDTTIQRYLATRHAVSFQWIGYGATAGVHHVVAKARLADAPAGLGLAQGAVGKRTLVVDPSLVAADATI